MTKTVEAAASFLAKAEKGDGQFAIAYALLQIADEAASLRRDLCLGTNAGDAASPGVLEMIAIELGALANATQAIADRDP